MSRIKFLPLFNGNMAPIVGILTFMSRINFLLLFKDKMSQIVGILTFMSRINFSCYLMIKCQQSYEQDECQAQLIEHKNVIYFLRPRKTLRW